ncbi:flotillin family protein [Haliangium sp.]|uniref:flotillin family protein n=1 Tax=Haliangium sp. TaxID=2663208 RepID=UPI003D0D9F51
MDKLLAESPFLLTLPVIVLGLLLVMMAVLRRLLFICRPNEVLIFSGGKRLSADGRTVGFRVIHGGWAIRRPFIETVERMDISLITVPMSMQGAYSEGGIPLNMHAIANVKVSSKPELVSNAIERFLGRGRNEIGRVAKETLEGHLRGVLATMTPEEVNEDRLKFAETLSDEAEDDLAKLGLEIDTLKIQHVSDERNYLESIGRKRVAEILAEAEVAESDARREAEESEAAADARGEVALTQAQANIQRKQNELRQIRAELEAEARAEEERAEAAAQEARATAEKELQRIRGALEELRLAADVTIPAEVGRRVKELNASGQAAHIFTDGEAMAESLRVIATAWQECGDQAMDMYVLQNLEDIFGQVAQAAANLKVREVNLVDSGDGKTLPAYASAYPATVGALLGEVSKTLGVDIPRIMAGRAGSDEGNGATRPRTPAGLPLPSSPSASASAQAQANVPSPSTLGTPRG